MSGLMDVMMVALIGFLMGMIGATATILLVLFVAGCYEDEGDE
jgi:hypothetical protein